MRYEVRFGRRASWALGFSLLLATFLLSVASGAAAAGAPALLTPKALVAELRKGGYVVVFRHASSPATIPDKKTANADNTKPERQLDDEGRKAATALGRALAELKIPIGDVFVSPTYRTRETARLAQLKNPQARDELAYSETAAVAVTDAQTAWLRKAVTVVPATANTFIVTHNPNFIAAFPDWGATIAQGEAAIFRPDGQSAIKLVGRIKIEEWSQLKP